MAKRRSRSALRAKAEDWRSFTREFEAESDRAAAVLGAAWLDAKLEGLLENFFVNDSKTVTPLFEPTGPLGTFAARSRLAYSLGLISRRSFDDLVLIRGIRNRFAHELHGVQFSDRDIVDACERLQSPGVFSAEGVVALKGEPRIAYELAVGVLGVFIRDAQAAALAIRRQVKEPEVSRGRRTRG